MTRIGESSGEFFPVKVSPKIWALVLIGAVIWCARYWHVGSFGLYEDDYTIVPRAVTMSLPELGKFVYEYIVHLSGHARPLSDSYIYIFSHLGWRVGGMLGVYVIGFLITTLNGILFYLLLQRIGNQAFAITGALAYCLFSADTTQVFLTHSLGLQPSMTLLLLASHLYLSDHRRKSYLLLPIILFSYETPFTIFYAIPLLRKRWQKSMLKELAFHSLILTAMLLGVFLLRSAIGEGRVSGLSSLQILTTPVTQMLIGPVVSLGLYLYRPIQAFQSLNREIVIGVLLGFVVFTGVISRLKVRPTTNFSSLMRLIRQRSFSSPDLDDLKAIVRLAIVGLITLALAYPLTYTIRAFVFSGRATRVHFAAVFGASILFACGCWLVLYLASLLSKQWIGSLLLAFFFAALLGYGFVIQRDYRVSWQNQQAFWTNVSKLVPDVEGDTVILVEPGGFQDVKQIDANTWNLPRIFDQIYQFPNNWGNSPRVYRLLPGWQKGIVANATSFRLDASTTAAPPTLYQQNVDPSRVVLLETVQGHLVRVGSSITINGNEFSLKEPSAPILGELQKGFLFNLLIHLPAN